MNAQQLLASLTHHIGKANGASADVLAAALGVKKRQIRLWVTELRMEGKHVCGTPNSGYFMAANNEEMEETCQFLRSRAMHSLVLEAKLRNVALPDLLGQMKLPT